MSRVHCACVAAGACLINVGTADPRHGTDARAALSIPPGRRRVGVRRRTGPLKGRQHLSAAELFTGVTDCRAPLRFYASTGTLMSGQSRSWAFLQCDCVPCCCFEPNLDVCMRHKCDVQVH